MKKRYFLLYTVFILSLAWGAPRLWSGAGDWLLSPGSTEITTVGEVDTGQWNASGVTVAHGGTGVVTLTDGGIILGSGTGAVTVLAQASNGQLPIGYTGADPVLATLTPDSGVSIVNKPGEISIGWSRIYNTDRITSGVTLTSLHQIVYADTDSGALIVGLPSGVDGTYYRLINSGSSGNDLTINPDESDTVRGAVTQTVSDGEIMILVFETTEKWW